MSKITNATGVEELAAIISQALENAGITATLSGGSAVSIYSDNQYQSFDLDYVTTANHRELTKALAPLGFRPCGTTRQYEHDNTEWLIEFPPGPLGFGELVISDNQIPLLDTEYGPLRIITPTQSVMDRLSAFWYHNDRQCRDQAIMVCRKQQVDWDALNQWATHEGRSADEIEKLRNKAQENS